MSSPLDPERTGNERRFGLCSEVILFNLVKFLKSVPVV
jgi:hypothetical protein